MNNCVSECRSDDACFVCILGKLLCVYFGRVVVFLSFSLPGGMSVFTLMVMLSSPIGLTSATN
jgi:hypothetical protein